MVICKFLYTFQKIVGNNILAETLDLRFNYALCIILPSAVACKSVGGIVDPFRERSDKYFSSKVFKAICYITIATGVITHKYLTYDGHNWSFYTFIDFNCHKVL